MLASDSPTASCTPVFWEKDDLTYDNRSPEFQVPTICKVPVVFSFRYQVHCFECTQAREGCSHCPQHSLCSSQGVWETEQLQPRAEQPLLKLRAITWLLPVTSPAPSQAFPQKALQLYRGLGFSNPSGKPPTAESQVAFCSIPDLLLYPALTVLLFSKFKEKRMLCNRQQ